MSQISAVLNVIKTYWVIHPEYSLCEIISNASKEMLNNTDCSNLKDVELEKYLRNNLVQKYENVS